MNKKAANKCILIKFGDNDFGTLMLAFARIINDENHTNYSANFFTKENIVNLWNDISIPLYFLVQNRGNYKASETILDNYLKIDSNKVFLDDEALYEINNNQEMWNSEWILIGLDGKIQTTLI